MPSVKIAGMAEVERLKGIELAFDEGLAVCGSPYHHGYMGNLVIVGFENIDTGEWSPKAGVGYSVEQALDEASRAFCQPNYPGPQFEACHYQRTRSGFDQWLERADYFVCQKRGNIVVFVGKSDGEVVIQEVRDCVLDVLDKAFPGEKDFLLEYQKKHPWKRPIIPWSVPLTVNPATLVSDRPLNSELSCSKFYLF